MLRHTLQAAAVVLLLPLAAMAQGGTSHSRDVARGIELFADIYRQLDLFYVDTISADTVVRMAIEGMLDEMDPYTVYYEGDDQDELRTMATGRYAGIGALIRYISSEDRAAIDQLYEGCPAQTAGLRTGDIIQTIDGKDVKGWDNRRVSQALRGEPGSTFELRVRRAGVKKPLSFRITRQQIQLPAVPWHGMVDSTRHVGYVRLSSVTDQCSRDVRYAVATLKEQGMTSLVLDLRGNPGGSLQEAVEIVGFFVPKGSLVVSTKGKLPSACRDYLTPAEPIDTVMPIAVLVNETSASAAEIISGTMQDMDRATIIGQRTYGKGLVQAVRETAYGGQLKITTSRYYIPSGRCIQAYDYRHRTVDGAATTLPDSLTREFRTRKGRIVRDGGGIQPDSIVADEMMPAMVSDLAASEACFRYLSHFMAQHESIDAPCSFRLTDDDYAAFVDTICASDFTYTGRSVQVLATLQQVLRYEGRADAFASQLAELEHQLSHTDMRSDLMLFRPWIQKVLETEIVSRYYYQSGGLRHSLQFDDCLHKAVQTLTRQ